MEGGGGHKGIMCGAYVLTMAHVCPEASLCCVNASVTSEYGGQHPLVSGERIERSYPGQNGTETGCVHSRIE